VIQTLTKMHLLVLLLLLVVFVSARELACDKDHIYNYKYSAKAKSFGGSGDSESENEQITTLTANIALTCSTKIPKNGHSALVYFVDFSKVLLEEKVPKNSGWKSVITGHNVTSGAISLDKYFSSPFAVIANSNGKLEEMYSIKKEEVWVRHMKKAVVEMLNSRLDGNQTDASHVEQSVMGPHTSHYTSRKDENGNKYVRRTWSQKDFPATAFHSAEILITGESQVVVNQNGVVLKAEANHTVNYGADDKKQHAIFDQMKADIGYVKGQHSDLTVAAGNTGLFTNSEATSVLVLIDTVVLNTPKSQFKKLFRGVRHPSQKHKIIDEKQAEQIVHKKKPKMVAHPHVGRHKLRMDKSMHKFMIKSRADRLLQQVDFEKSLEELLNNKDMNLHAILAKYVRHHPKKSVPILTQKFEQATSDKKQIEQLAILQSLMIAAQTKQGQDAAVKTIQDANLAHTFIIGSLSFKKPSQQVIEFLKKLKNKEQAFSEGQDEISTMAYLAYADSASRVRGPTRKAIIKDIMSNIMKNTNESLITDLHALANAKHATPISIWKMILSHPHIESNIHHLAVDSLRHRCKHGKDDKAVSDLIHEVVASKHIDPAVKSTAVRVQAQRHGQLHHREGKSIEVFASHYHDLPKDTRQAIAEYMYTVGTYKAGDTLSKLLSGKRFAKTHVKNSEKQFMSDSNGIKDIFNNIKAKFSNSAAIEGTKTCTTISLTDEQICTVNSDLASDIRALGLSKAEDAKGFDYEKLIGSENAHLYVGTVGLAAHGMKKCAGTGLKLEALGYGRGKVDAKILGNRFTVVDVKAGIGGIEAAKTSDSASVKVFTSVVWTKNFSGSKTILSWSKSFNNIINQHIHVMAGPFPLDFGISVSISFGIDGEVTWSPNALQTSLSANPNVNVGVSGEAALTAWVAKGGIRLSVSMSYDLKPSIDFNKCTLCVQLDHDVQPASITVSGFASAIGFEKEKDLYHWDAKAISGTLLRKCT
jgi:hypothetical protein